MTSKATPYLFYLSIVLLNSPCYADNAEVRLIGQEMCAGRVELHFDGEWRTVCDNYWDLRAADVVCRQLHCGEAVSAPRGAHYGEGPGPIWERKPRCTGRESLLSQCPEGNPDDQIKRICTHAEDASVVCTGNIRVDGADHCSGRVEVHHAGQWGAVCAAGWQMKENKVACEQLGCGQPASIPVPSQFGQSAGLTGYNISCIGNETSLSQCTFTQLTTENCGHGGDAAVLCEAKVRLMSGEDKCSGRVEIRHQDRWGTVCDDSWGLSNGEVVCRELGCGKLSRVTHRASFGMGSGPVWLDDVECTGSETSIIKCSHRGFGISNCGHPEDAGVVCGGNVRLVNGTDLCSGRVELRNTGTWAAVCSDGWGTKEAKVLCKQLGCGSAGSVSGSNNLGNDGGARYSISCSGTESSLLECAVSNPSSTNCSHGGDASVVCEADVRLFNGTDKCSGRVEVFHNGAWGTVCNDEWEMTDAEVVCQQLGCGKPLNFNVRHLYGEGENSIWMDNVECSGSEVSLTDCPHGGFGKHNCKHDEDVGVICSVRPKKPTAKDNVKIRLVGPNRCYGRVEVFYEDHWGTVCDKGWDINAAEVVCRQLDCGDALLAPGGAKLGEGTGLIWLDNLRCSGNESYLSQCQQLGDGSSCTHVNDASVICSGTIRLVNGTGQCSGRVEVNHNGRWGAVCSDGWGMKEAEVACRHQDCGIPVSATAPVHYGHGSGPNWNVVCTGNETSLTKCSVTESVPTACGRGGDAAVHCKDNVQLVNGTDRCSGRIEIYHGGQWGTVCDDSWSLINADVVCKQLGCGTALSASHAAYYGQGTGPIWVDDVVCNGQEVSLTQCQHGGFGVNDCRHEEDAGVYCSDRAHVRLVNGSDVCSGRVEIFHKGQWGTVCGTGWSLHHAELMCKQLECGPAVSAPGGAHFGQGQGPVWSADRECFSSEQALIQCSLEGLSKSSCSHSEDVGIVCSEKIRLVEGQSECSGRVEVFHAGQWGTVCDDEWDKNDAVVLCRQLGCGSDGYAFGGAFFGQGTGPIWLDDFNCTGSESALSHCKRGLLGVHNCDHSEDAAVMCSAKGNIRIANGPTECSGRIELLHRGQWGTVCGRDWNMYHAEEACKLLDCAYAVSVHGGAHFGQGTGPVLKADLGCFHSEKSLIQCSLHGFNTTNCDHSDDAGIVCSEKVRLVNGPRQCTGRVEVYHGNKWGTVCDDHWDMSDAEVVCRQLGCGDALGAVGDAHFGVGSGPIWLDHINCSGTESSLHLCDNRGFGSHSCNHGEDAGVVCTGKTHVRLVNGTDRCSGRLEVLHNNQWGTICGQRWSLEYATTVCSEIQCDAAVSAPQSGKFGPGSGPVWQADDQCFSSLETLTKCSTDGFQTAHCDHSEDAGVTCSERIKLVNGNSECSGRLELYYADRWGTVCDDLWNQKNAEVVCRQIGCGKPAKSSELRRFGSTSGPIWLDNVRCHGNETSISQCEHAGFGKTNCDHSEDVSVVCSETDSLRLVGGNNKCSGRVEVFHDGQWGTICGTGWSLNYAELVCGQLGCGQAVEAQGGALFGQGSGPVFGASRQCFSTSRAFRVCSVDGFSTTSCKHDDDASVKCLDNLRLVNGDHACSGRVEVARNGQWGTVCDDRWNLHAANVVCRQLSCGEAINAPDGAHFGRGTGDIMLDDVVCTGNENSLFECVHSTSHDCSHSEDAAVVCLVKLRLPSISLAFPGAGQVSKVTMGHSFSIVCTVPPQYPGGIFYLTFSGSSTNETKPAVNHSASFDFPFAEYKNQGNYSCVYGVTVSSMAYYSKATQLRVTVSAGGSNGPVVSGLLVGTLLLVLLLAALFILWRKRRSFWDLSERTDRTHYVRSKNAVSLEGESDEDDTVGVYRSARESSSSEDKNKTTEKEEQASEENSDVRSHLDEGNGRMCFEMEPLVPL